MREPPQQKEKEAGPARSGRVGGTDRPSGREEGGRQASLERAFSQSYCDTCGVPVDASKERCADHQHKTGDQPVTETPAQIVVIIADGSTQRSALATAAAALEVRSDVPDQMETESELIADMVGEPSALTAGWDGPLDDGAPADTSVAARMVEEAASLSQWGGGAHSGDREYSDSRVYDEMGNPLKSQSDVDQAIEECDSPWVVPAFVEITTETTVSGKPIRDRECPTCSGETQHVFDGNLAARVATTELDTTRWTCLECDTTHEAPVGDVELNVFN